MLYQKNRPQKTTVIDKKTLSCHRNFPYWIACARKIRIGESHRLQYWGLDSIQQHIYGLADRLRKKLSEIDGITLTDEGIEKCGIVTFISNRLPPPAIKAALGRKRINVSTSKGSGSLVPFRERGLEEVVRASAHYFNTDEEIDYFAETLDRLTKR